MSSHREAPEISKDPVADNADVYAFVSPDRSDTVTMITNFVPLQGPDGGPNSYEFGDDVLYSINIDNDGDGKPEISYVFRFNTKLRDPDTFLYNVGPITSLASKNWNKRQFYSVVRVEGDDTSAYGTSSAHKHHLRTRCSDATSRARRATSGRARRRTTTSSVRPRFGRWQRHQGVRGSASGRLLR